MWAVAISSQAIVGTLYPDGRCIQGSQAVSYLQHLPVPIAGENWLLSIAADTMIARPKVDSVCDVKL